MDDEVLLERWMLAELDAWSSTVIISSGQGKVGLLVPVFKAKSHAFAGNRDLLGNDVCAAKFKSASVSEKFKGVIRNGELREVEGFLEERDVFVDVLTPGGSELLSIKFVFKDNFVLLPSIGNRQYEERLPRLLLSRPFIMEIRHSFRKIK